MQVVLFFLLFSTCAFWALSAYVEYGYRYRVAHDLPRASRWNVFMGSGYEWGIMFERQAHPEVERLRKRVLRRYGLMYLLLFAFGLFAVRVWR